MTEWDSRPIEDIEAATALEAAPESAIDDRTGGDSGDAATASAVPRQLLLLGLFALAVVVLMAFASTVLATGAGCGGG